MSTSCNGICHRFESIGIAMQLKYKEGQKRCSFCGIFIECEGVRCPCCPIILRTKARNSKSKRKRPSTGYQ